MLETITPLIIIMNTSAIGLGVGASTLAIISFLVALHDGTIDTSERRMLGVIYSLLRFAMVSILITLILIIWLQPSLFGSQTTYIVILVGIIFLNAIAMTKHWISSKVGPALQAASWYTLGFISTIHMFSLYKIDALAFVILYGIDIVFFIVLVNVLLHISITKQKTTHT
ncbi:MAG TPA: hypothetical protein VFV22_00790 [Candidatus Paceibacterota bacterium]|nr:hypothetical protein [Candidatus Paceibacterota bacterium]